MVVHFWKYWLIKNERNDNDVKLMKWLMTGGNHGTIDICGENVSLHCEKMVGRSSDRIAIYRLTKAPKLELGSQLPIKSPFKYSGDVIKRLNNDTIQRDFGLNSNMPFNWSNERIDIVREYKGIGCIELALPSSTN